MMLRAPFNLTREVVYEFNKENVKAKGVFTLFCGSAYFHNFELRVPFLFDALKYDGGSY